MLQKIYPRSKDKETVYLKSVITNPNIIVGDYTMYNDFVKEPKDLTDIEIGKQLNISRSTVQYRRTSSFEQLKKYLEENADEWIEW